MSVSLDKASRFERSHAIDDAPKPVLDEAATAINFRFWTRSSHRRPSACHGSALRLSYA
jgi:hypothetical protein